MAKQSETTPAMQVEFRDIASLKPHPRNSEWRTHPQEQVNELAELLTEFGWLRNVVLSSDGYIVAGHGILTAAKQRGELTAPTVTMPHKHDSPECLKFLVAENTVQTRAATEPEGLAALLADIQQQSATGLAGTGYDAGQLDALIASMAAEGAEWPQLLDGDRQPFQQMTFTLSDEQAETVKSAMAAARDAGPFVDTGNENGNGNALARVCEAYGG